MKKTFGQKLKELRERKGKRVAEVSIIVCVPVRSLYEYESGATVPDQYKQIGILDRLGRAK